MPACRSARGLGLTVVMLLCAASAMLIAASTVAARSAWPGSLDTSFGSGGIVAPGAGTRLFGTAVQGDGKVLAVGEIGTQGGTTLLLARFTAAGTLDTTFGVGGVVRGPAIPGLRGGGSIGRAVAVQADGKIVVVGTVTTSVGTGRFGLLAERYNANGSLDPGFGTAGVVDVLSGQSSGQGYAVAIQPDGKIIATGSADVAGAGSTTPHATVVRLNKNGGLDPSFGAGGTEMLALGDYSYALAVALEPDGRIVIAGSQAPGQLAPSALIARLTPSGGLDPSFAGTGFYIRQFARGAASSAFNAVAVQSDGNIIAAGAALDGSSGADMLVVRFTPSGAPDDKFGSGGVAYNQAAVYWSQSTPTVPGGYGVLIAPNGDAVVAGLFANSSTTYATLWALTPAGSLDRAFGHGGAAVLTNSFGDYTEYLTIALSPATGEFVAAGDSLPPFNGSYSGIAARYVGFDTFGAPDLQGIRRSYKTSKVVGRGLKLTVGCEEACTITVALTVSAATARKLHLRAHHNTPVTLAAGRVALRSSGHKSTTLRLSRGAGAALEKQKRVVLTLVVSATETATNRTQLLKRAITFAR